MAELGRIDKPEATRFEGKRKLYVVPLLFDWKDSPQEYRDKLNLYWQQAREQVANLESRIGTVNAVFHESVTSPGDEGLRILEKLNTSSHQIVREKYLMGARFEVIEDRELLEETMDWERHLILGFVSGKVARMVSQFFSEASKKRNEHISSKLGEGLREGEVGLLIISEGHQVQFPSDIEVFLVAPPSLNEVHRWLRERQEKEDRDEADPGGNATAEGPPAPKE
jgi:hypothetical protein